MKISRVAMFTLGEVDSGKATKFYEAFLGSPPDSAGAKTRPADLRR